MSWLRYVLSAAIAVGVVGALGEGGTDPSSHLLMPGHIVHAPVLGDLNPMPFRAPVLKTSNKTNITFGGVGSGTVVDRCEVAYNADDIFGSNLSVVLSMGNGAFDTSMVQQWHGD